MLRRRCLGVDPTIFFLGHERTVKPGRAREEMLKILEDHPNDGISQKSRSQR